MRTSFRRIADSSGQEVVGAGTRSAANGNTGYEADER